MTALIMDGFDHYGSGSAGMTNMLSGSWAQTQTIGIAAGLGVPPWGTRTGSYSLCGNSFSGSYRRVLPSALSNMFMSFGFSCSAIPGAGFLNSICSFRTSSNVVIATMWLQADGSISLTNAAGAQIAATQGPVITAQNWHFIELNINQGSGGFTLRVDDTQASNPPVINATGLNFGASSIGQFTVLDAAFSSFNEVTTWMDDLFVRDTNGTTNNSWLGDRQIATLFVNADTTTKGWTPNYYHEFGAGILTLSHIIPTSPSAINPTACITTPAATALDIGGSDFTLETFVRFDALPASGNYSSIFNRWNVVGNARSYRLILGGKAFNNGCLQFDTSIDGTANTVVSKLLYPWTPALNTWYHIAVVRAAGELLLFVNGQQLGLPIADNQVYYSGGTETFSLGLEVQTVGNLPTFVANTNLIGRLDETRFTNGIGRYTGPFSVPTVALPRGLADPDWSQVVLILGYDSGIIDESSYARPVSAFNGAVSFIPSDGPAVGVYSTVNKQIPDDNTFISAGLSDAYAILTMTTQPNNGDTVTVGTTDGTTAAVYTFVTALTGTAFQVLIDPTTAQNTLMNLLNAINAGAGSGITYGTGTTSNYNVNAIQLPVGQIEVVANLAGTVGNTITSTSTGTAAVWATPTLVNGTNIPGPTNFKFQRPPNNTTVISAMQTTVRALKTDSGTANIQTALVGPLGHTTPGNIHALTMSPQYYSDIIEIDPDTSGPLTPTTIINGQFQINRTQ